MSMEFDATCPYCFAIHNRVGTGDDDQAMPRDGDITICFVCGEFSVFEDDKMCKPNSTQWVKIASSPDARKMRAAWEAMRLTHLIQ